MLIMDSKEIGFDGDLDELGIITIKIYDLDTDQVMFKGTGTSVREALHDLADKLTC